MATVLADDIFNRIFLEWKKIRISIKISIKFVPKGPINKIPALFQTMAWRRPGDKPLSEPMLPQFTDAYAALGGDELVLTGTIGVGCIYCLEYNGGVTPRHMILSSLRY